MSKWESLNRNSRSSKPSIIAPIAILAGLLCCAVIALFVGPEFAVVALVVLFGSWWIITRGGKE